MRIVYVLILTEFLSVDAGVQTPSREILELRNGSVSAVGTWFDTINNRFVSDVIDDGKKFEAATTSIACEKELHLCSVADARIHDGRLSTWVRVYAIRIWKAGYVQAVLKEECVE